MLKIGRLRAAFLWLALVSAISPTVFAQANQQGNFSLQVTPSPLVLSIKPGSSVATELKIRNNGDKTENLKIDTRSFNINSDTGAVTLNDSQPTDVKNWVTFTNPTFTIEPGQWFTVPINVHLPSDAGFSYSFALVISRQSDATQTQPGQTALKGSVAVFTLIAVDRPDAKREVQLIRFAATRQVYEYLPVDITTTLKNTGNTIVQPYGNIFIQRGSKSSNPISTLPVNEGKGYILPGSSRTLTTSWQDGFPVYQELTTAANAKPAEKLVWDWNKLSELRIGKYTAKLVAVYNDGSRDVPIEAETSFWVIPWRLIIGLMLIVALIIVGVFTLIKKSFITIKRSSRNHKKDPPHENQGN